MKKKRMLWCPQSEALEALSVVYQEGEGENQWKQPQIVQIPTGCGKSTVIALLPRYLIPDRHCTVLVIVPTLLLVEQTISAIQRAYERHPRAQIQQEDIKCISILSLDDLERCIDEISLEGNTPVDEEQVKYRFLVCNVHKLHQRNGVGSGDMPLWQKIEDWIDIVAVDEAHHMVASMWKNFLFRPDALGGRMKRQILLTATPFRTDEVPLTGEMCYRYAYRRGIEAGLIKHPIIHLCKLTDSMEARDLRDIRLLRRTESLLSTGQAIGYAQDIADAKRIRDLARLHTTLKVKVWHSVMSDEKQRAVRSRFEQCYSDPSQRIDMVIQVKMCVEGYDHPLVNVVTFFRVIRSPLFFIQAIGRAARRTAIDRQMGRALVSYVVTDSIYCSSSLWEHFKAHSDDGHLVDFSSDDFGEDDESPSFPPLSSSLSQFDLDQEPNDGNRSLLSSSSSFRFDSDSEQIQVLFDSISTVDQQDTISNCSPAEWWIDCFDQTLNPSILPFSLESEAPSDDDDEEEEESSSDDNDEEEDDNDNDDIEDQQFFEAINNGPTIFPNNDSSNLSLFPTMISSNLSERSSRSQSSPDKISGFLKCIPCLKEPFVLSKSAFREITPSPSSSRVVEQPKTKKLGRPRKNQGPSMESLTENDVKLVSLPPPLRQVFTAVACYNCPCEQVRELDLKVLQWIFLESHKKKEIERILSCNNRLDGKPLISDRLFVHYHEQRKQKKQSRVRSRPTSSEFDGGEATKRQRVPSEPLKKLEEPGWWAYLLSLVTFAAE